MSLPSYEWAMTGFTTEGLSPAEAKDKRLPKWNWSVGATLVGPYLDGTKLAACCLVSKDFHKSFAPILWLNPLLMLKDVDRPFYKMYQFVFIAQCARLELRSLVQTLDFALIPSYFKARRTPPNVMVEKMAFDFLYRGAWFMDCARLFPQLRFILMDGLRGLSYVKSGKAVEIDPLGLFRSRNPDNTIATASDAAGNLTICNADPSYSKVEPVDLKPVVFAYHGTGRIILLKEIYTPNLMYLDLSYTMRDTDSYPGIFLEFRNLRVLKLRGCRLVDPELFRWIPVQLWCLDLRDNFLTDVVIEHILPHLFLESIQPPKPTADELRDGHLYEDVPDYRQSDDEMRNTIAPLRPYERKKFIDYLKDHASFPSINDQILDGDDPLLRRTGLTHLFISNNKLSSRGVKFLLQETNRLQHLDVGSVEASNSHKFYVAYTSAHAQLNSRSTIGLLRESGSRMEVLRIHHSIVTFTPTLIYAGSRNNGYSLPLVKQAEDYGALLRLDHMLKEPKQFAFSPLQNYRITDLTLTGLPRKSYGFIVDRLTSFLTDCAMQEAILNAARRKQPNRRAPQLLKGLRTLRLNFLPEDTTQAPNSWSVSGDPDADNFLASSEGDFSFFGQDTMSSVSRRGSAATVSGSGAATSPASDKGSFIESMASQRHMSGFIPTANLPEPTTAPPPLYNEILDVVDEVRKWRAKNLGRWTGTVKVEYVSSP